MDKIKLVIWDLDETFWNGTLSEEGIEAVEDNINLIKELTDRGIINSICSKNTFEQAQEKLKQLGIWEYFVFPSINWGPKGTAIKQIIEDCQLRDVNVLFLDDNHSNLEEAKFYNENLHVKMPEFIKEIRTHKAFKGKDDSSHSRLKQYKILEEKAVAKQSFSDNTSFLESSDIKISFLRDHLLIENIDRAVELLERTNQLNFTKVRSSKEELKELLNNSDYETALIHVKDNFGDYGLVGIYSINKESKVLKHFTFSCRILNLGVAQYVYAKLKFPNIEIIPEVAETLDKTSPSWITETSYEIKKENNKASKGNLKVLFKGGCDLSQMTFYLNDNNFDIQDETNYVSKNNFPIHKEHSISLLDSKKLDQELKTYAQESEFIPFIDEDYFRSEVFNGRYDCLIYSVLMDYTQELYKHKNSDLLLPFGAYINHWNDEKNDSLILKDMRSKGVTVDENFLVEFRNNFERVGKISAEAFKNNIREIVKNLPENIPLILINGTELNSPKEEEQEATERHILMNKAVDELVEELSNVYLLDVRKIVTSKTQLTDNIRHYNREAYKAISVALLELLNETFDASIKTNISLKNQVKDSLRSNIKPILRKIKSSLKK